MKAIGLTDFGGPDVLGVFELPSPQPGAGEVRIRVHAAAVNPTDVTLRSGGRAEQLRQFTPPWIPGMDAAGVIDALGPSTDGRLAVGDRVIAYVIPITAWGGAYAEQIVVPEASVVHAPDGASLAEAATIPLNALTARLALDTLALKASQPVVITGAAGAVGGYAIELARADGLRPIAQATVADESLVRGLGAGEVISRDDDLATAVQAVLGQLAPGLIDGADLRTGALGAIADGGALASLKGWRGPGERGITVHAISSFNAAQDTAMLRRMRDAVQQKVLTPRVAEVLPAARAGEAHRRLSAGGLRGRIVLDFAHPIPDR